MRKKFLVTCSLLLCLLMVGCGANSEEAAATEAPAAEEQPAMPNPPEDTVVDEAPEAEMASEEPAEYAELEAAEEATEEVVAKEPKEIQGIVALIMTASNEFIVVNIDPDSGNIATLARFVDMSRSADGKYHYYLMERIPSHTNYREIFSPDFDKIALTQMDAESGVTHAGWMDSNGEFFDVTAVLYPDAGSSFSDVVRHVSSGFTEDGYFVYNDNHYVEGSSYFSVPINNVSLSEVAEYSWGNIGSTCANGERIIVTDHITSTRHLVDHKDAYAGIGSKIYDEESDELYDYIPESNRTNWGGVVSPDGEKIAFLSIPDGGTKISIFITSLSGGEPTELVMSPTLNDVFGDLNSSDILKSSARCTLIDWK